MITERGQEWVEDDYPMREMKQQLEEHRFTIRKQRKGLYFIDHPTHGLNTGFRTHGDAVRYAFRKLLPRAKGENG